MTKYNHTRVDLGFKNQLKQIKLDRIKNGYDNEMKSDRLLTRELIKCQGWKYVKEDLIKKNIQSDNKNKGRHIRFNKKGQAFLDTFVLMIIGFIMLVGFAIFMYAIHTSYIKLGQSFERTPTNLVNMTDVNEKTFGYFDIGLGGLRIIAFSILFGMIILIFLSNFLIKNNPIYFVFYIIMTVVAIIVSVPISNAYESLMSDAVLGTYLATLKEGSFIFLKLPVVIAVVGIFGLIFLLAGNLRDTGLEGGLG